MRVPGALAFLIAASLRNRFLHQLKRLRRPRYLVAFLVGVAWFWTFVFRRMQFDEQGFSRLPDEARPVIIWGGTAFAVLGVLATWIFGSSRPVLTFTEAEIQLLFPGPVSRRQLLAWKITRNLLLVAVSALFTTLVFGARLTGHGVFFFLAAWTGLGLWSLHSIGASLTRSRLLLHRRVGIPVIALGVLVVVGGLAAFVGRAYPALDFANAPLESVAVLDGTPLGLLLYPVRAPLLAAFAPDLPQFLPPFITSLVLVALHGLWVLSSDVAFEEASVEEAEKRARRLEARRSVQSNAPAKAKKSYRLGPGRPELSLAWKNAIAVRRVFGGRVAAALLPFVFFAVAVGFIIGTAGVGAGLGPQIGLTALILGTLLILMGPGALRTDFRMELKNLDLLRALPLSGVQVVIGQLLAPMLVIGGAQVLLFTLGFALIEPVGGFPLAGGARFPFWIASVLVAPLLTAAGLVVQNAVVLIVPSWVSDAFERPRGVEALGQRLIGFIGTLLVLVIGVLPAAGVAVVSIALGWGLIAEWSVMIGGMLAAAVLAFELALAVWLMGRLFDRLDVSAEA